MALITLCRFPECGRPVRAKKLCQQHYKLWHDGRKLRPLRAISEKRYDTVRFVGIRIRRAAVDVLEAFRVEAGISQSAMLSKVAEEWAECYRRVVERRSAVATPGEPPP